MLSVARRAANCLKFVADVLRYFLLLRRERIALLHLNNSITRQLEWMIAARIARVRCVVHERGLNPAYSIAQRAMARRVSVIIAISEWVRKHLVAHGVSGANIRVHYDGFDASRVLIARSDTELRRTWQVDDRSPVVGIVGNIREWKGQDVVVRALARVVEKHPDIVCFFVGAATPADQPFVDRLTQLVAESGLERNVRFTGYQKDVASFIHMMQVVLHASTEPEPFGMVVLEAMAQRKPVIGSRAGGVTETVVDGETGYTFAPGDSQEMAQHLIHLLNKPDTAKQLGYNGYLRLATRFNQRRYVDEIQGLYRSLFSAENSHHPQATDECSGAGI